MPLQVHAEPRSRNGPRTARSTVHRPPSITARSPLVVVTILVALVATSRAHAAAPSFVVAPYLQHLDQHAVHIRFETQRRSTASVEVSDGNSTPIRVHADQKARFHDIRVDGLMAGTSYQYRVHTGESTTDPATFATPPDDPSRPFSFVVYGDCRSNHDAHAKVVTQIAEVPFDFLLQTGDLVHTGDSAAQWRRFFEIEGSLLASKPVFVSVGNHDLNGWLPRRHDTFLKYFGPGTAMTSRTYFTFRWGNARVFVLDATVPWGGPQQTWLRHELGKAREEPGIVHRIVAMHHSPYSSGPHGPNAAFVSAGGIDLLRAGGVELVVAGHDHLYERGEHDGIKYVISGGAGAPLYLPRDRAPGSGFAAAVHHFVLVRVEGEHVALSARGADGSVLEDCEFHKGRPWSCQPAPATGGVPGASEPSPLPPGRSCGCVLPGARAPAHAARNWSVLLVALLALQRRRRGTS